MIATVDLPHLPRNGLLDGSEDWVFKALISSCNCAIKLMNRGCCRVGEIKVTVGDAT